MICNIFFFFSEHYQVKRTCTDNFDVNFFMVNHACMTEGHRHGHMCFCVDGVSRVALVFFTKALMTMPVAFLHTGMIHHEKVHIKIISTGPFHLIVFFTEQFDFLHLPKWIWYATFSSSFQNTIRLNEPVPIILMWTFSWWIMPVWRKATGMVICAFVKKTSATLLTPSTKNLWD